MNLVLEPIVHEYCYIVDQGTDFQRVLDTLNLALIAVQSLHGESRAALDARYASDCARRRIVIDASTEVGQAFNDLFVGYAFREFGLASMSIERMPATVIKSPSD